MAGQDRDRPKPEPTTMDQAKCPMCAEGEVSRTEGKLEQSGATYLPTSVWRCNSCGYVRYDPAPSAQWRPLAVAEDDAGAEAPHAGRRAA